MTTVMSSTEVVAKCFTKSGAHRKARKLMEAKEKNTGRSSGWKRFDYGVTYNSWRLLRKWIVYAR